MTIDELLKHLDTAPGTDPSSRLVMLEAAAHIRAMAHVMQRLSDTAFESLEGCDEHEWEIWTWILGMCGQYAKEYKRG